MTQTTFARRRRQLAQQRDTLQQIDKAMNNILRTLLCIVAGISGIAAGAQYLTILPPGTVPESWIKFAMAASLIMLAVKEGIIVIGDILDDGQANHSFNIDQISSPVPKRGSPIEKLLMGLLFPVLLVCSLPSCEAAKSFLVANEPAIESMVVYGAKTAVRTGTDKLRPAKQPVNVQP